MLRTIVPGILGGLFFYQGLIWVNDFLPGYQGPWWVRFGLLLLPWLVLGLFLKIQRRLWREDELEVLINRQALSFTLYGLLMMVVVADQLQAAGWLPAFTWTRDGLVMATGGLLAIGLVWSKSRYR